MPALRVVTPRRILVLAALLFLAYGVGVVWLLYVA